LYNFDLDDSVTPNVVRISQVTTKYSEPNGSNREGEADDIDDEYNAMVDSINQYKGFYIGRYETSIRNGNTAQTTAGAAPLIGDDWYNIYSIEKSYVVDNNITSVTSGMIYGSEWDQVMIWMKDIKNTTQAVTTYYILNPSGMGWYNNDSTGTANNTGTLPTARVKNIYDMAGNVWEWTQEIQRNSGSKGFATFHVFRDVIYRDYGVNDGSRMQLYINP